MMKKEWKRERKYIGTGRLETCWSWGWGIHPSSFHVFVPLIIPPTTTNSIVVVAAAATAAISTIIVDDNRRSFYLLLLLIW